MLGKNKQLFIPCHPTRARQWLVKGQVAMFRQAPFTRILLKREGGFDLSLQSEKGGSQKKISPNGRPPCPFCESTPFWSAAFLDPVARRPHFSFSQTIVSLRSGDLYRCRDSPF